MAASKPDKAEIYWKVLKSVMVLDFRKGHQRWTISDLSRDSKVTRPLIYYYFGKSKPEILRQALSLVGEELFGLSVERMKLWESGDIATSVLATRKIFDENPQLPAFYLSQRYKNTEFSEMLEAHEKNHLKKLQKFFPKKSVAELKALWGLLFGLVFAPALPDDAVRAALKELE